MIKINYISKVLPTENALIITLAEGAGMGDWAVKLDKIVGGTIKRAIDQNGFKGAEGAVLEIVAPAPTKLSRIIVIGLGKLEEVNEVVMQRIGGIATATLKGKKDRAATFILDGAKGMKISQSIALAHIGLGARLRSYRFDKYHTKLDGDKKPALEAMNIACDEMAGAKALYHALDAVADGVGLARDLVSEPANVIYPESLMQQCVQLRKLGIKVDVLDEKQMKKLGMGALLGVAQGSVNKPYLVAMTWRGKVSAKNKNPVALVGKGVTFDTGGISIKPAVGMEEMKFDMGGSAAVIGTMMALAKRKAKAYVVGVVGLVENMPSGNAQRPGDVVTTMSGQTVEVINTDAEGRLVLADAVWYTQEKFAPKCVIDLATLTGAIIVALGHEYAGIFSNDNSLAKDLLASGKVTDEKLWRMPMSKKYDKEINSAIADMKNMGGKGAGSIAGAQFIGRFIKKDMPWAHLDIAGTAWNYQDTPTCPKGASAYGVQLLNRFIADYHEEK